MTEKTMAKRFDLQSVATSETRAKGGRAKKGKSEKLMHAKLAEVVVSNAKRKKKLTPKEMLQIAGYSPQVVRKRTAEVWSTQGLRDALANHGFTQEKMTKVLKEASEARVVAVFKGDARETEAPDHAIRLRAVDQLADVMGLKKMTLATLNVDVNMSEEDTKKLLGL